VNPVPTAVPLSATVGAAAPTPAAAATGRPGGGGPLSLLWWQAPTILNAHLSLATKDVGAVRIYAEPLADFNARNELVRRMPLAPAPKMRPSTPDPLVPVRTR
jgi:peptide/nickel transport system substrate-binding protein